MGRARARALGRVSLSSTSGDLFDLSAQLMSVEPSRIGKEIGISLRQAGEFWASTRSPLPKHQMMARRAGAYLSCPRGRPAPPRDSQPRDSMGGRQDRFGRRGSPVEALRRTHRTGRDKQYFAKYGVESALILPCGRDRPESVVLSALSIGRGRPWPPEFVKVFRHLGKILTGALERKRVVERIRRDAPVRAPPVGSLGHVHQSPAGRRRKGLEQGLWAAEPPSWRR